MPQPNPTATDDALKALMDAVWTLVADGGADGPLTEQAVRTAAERYGRAVAIAELEALEDAGTFADIAAEKRIAELRAADSTGGT